MPPALHLVFRDEARGEPFVFINDGDAAALGVAKGEQVRLVNNAGETLVAAKLSPSVRPGQPIPADRAIRIDAEKVG